MKMALEALCCARDMVAHPDNLEFIDRHTTALRERLAQPEQEPFCYHDGRNIVGKEFADHSDVFPLYTAPQPRQWQRLTDEEMEALFLNEDGVRFARYIESRLKDKNA
jgi:hypothetical protein